MSKENCTCLRCCCDIFWDFIDQEHLGDPRDFTKTMDRAAIFFACLPITEDGIDPVELANFKRFLFTLRDVSNKYYEKLKAEEKRKALKLLEKQ